MDKVLHSGIFILISFDIKAFTQVNSQQIWMNFNTFPNPTRISCVIRIKGMSGQSTISIIFTNLGPFGANSVITFGISFGIRWYTSIFQKLHRFPGN